MIDAINVVTKTVDRKLQVHGKDDAYYHRTDSADSCPYRVGRADRNCLYGFGQKYHT